VVQGLKIHLPMQGMWVPSLIWENPRVVEELSLCATTTEPVVYSPLATLIETHVPRACALQQGKSLK